MVSPLSNSRTLPQSELLAEINPVPDFVAEENADASILCAANGVVVAWSKGATDLFGWDANEAIGKSILDLVIVPQYRAALESDIEQFCDSNQHPKLNRRLKAILLHKNRSNVQVEYRITSFCVEKERYFGISVWNRTRDSKKFTGQHTSMLNLSRDAIIVTNIENDILFWNQAAERMFGFSEQEAIGRKSHALLSARYPINIIELEQQLISCGHWEGEVVYTARDGTAVPTLSRWVLEQDSDKSDARILISNIDINILKRNLEASFFMHADGQSFNSLFGFHPDGVLAFNLQGELIAANPAMSVLTGYSNKELLNLPFTQIVVPEDIAKLRFNFAEALRGTPETQEFCCVKKNKTRFDASITMLPHVVDNRVEGLHVIVKDVSHRKLDERRILYLATHDPLTGLANRNLLNDRMKHAIEKARRLKSQIAILHMDLNRFKVINDSLGHDKGDILLCTIADRLKGAVREVDTVARLGGDEFVILLENISEADHVSTVAKNLLKLVKQPVDIDGDVITVSTSIGASVYPQDGNDAATLLKNADLAMYEAKRAASGSFHFYTAEMNVKALGQLARENSLRRAIDHGELVLHYQPRLDIIKNELVGVEALVRWEHPEKGLIMPANFISLAEEIGVIDELGEWVLKTACRQLKAWQDAGMLPIKMSVNVSAMQLRSDGLFDAIEAALADTSLNPEYLDLEITESSLMQDLDMSFDKLMKIRNLGITLSIDDFGTGYSSLSYLKRLPIDTLKIDKSFVRDVPENIDDSAIVSATIAMAHSMNLRVVAEGVTSFDQMRFLDACHCDEIQGYLLCQPLPSLDTESFFRTSQLRGIYYSWAH
jgi:diguanylate cyclase (GGDEF)-like protein/PAS domain S-box-containing protein